MTIIDEKTPRTRNRVLDNSISMTQRPALMRPPEGHNGDWTLRKQIEADFRALGFKSHKFSHKNEPETRLADSLWLSWNSDNKKRPAGSGVVTDIEVRVTFAAHRSAYDGLDYKTVFTVTYAGRPRGACVAHRMGQATFTIDWTDTSDVMTHINRLLTL